MSLVDALKLLNPESLAALVAENDAKEQKRKLEEEKAKRDEAAERKRLQRRILSTMVGRPPRIPPPFTFGFDPGHPDVELIETWKTDWSTTLKMATMDIYPVFDMHGAYVETYDNMIAAEQRAKVIGGTFRNEIIRTHYEPPIPAWNIRKYHTDGVTARHNEEESRKEWKKPTWTRQHAEVQRTAITGSRNNPGFIYTCIVRAKTEPEAIKEGERIISEYLVKRDAGR